MLKFSDSDTERLFEEFIDFKALEEKELELTEAILEIYDDGSIENRMDVIWYLIQQLKSSEGNCYRFRLLFQVARLVLITPHSNAGIERVFSLLNKNKSESSDRNRLDIERSILAVKLDCPESFSKCYNLTPSEKLIVDAKKATTKYNNLHSNKDK